MKEDYCSFKLSKLLKEKGFDFENQSEGIKELLSLEDNEIYITITHALAMKWLREVHGVIITISPTTNILGQFNGYLISMDKLVDKALNFQDEFGLDGLSYGQAVEDALKYSLENLI